MRISILFLTVLGSVGLLAAQTSPQVKRTVASETSPASGKDMYVHYCASCHGKEGKGDGPAAAAMKVAPTDLTQLAAKNKGNFPEVRVARIIDGSDTVGAHGSREMPTWAELFHSMEGDKSPTAKMRIANLTAHLRSLQAK